VGRGIAVNLMILEMLFTFIAVIPVYFLNGVAIPE
jgi:hypothetical protein